MSLRKHVVRARLPKVVASEAGAKREHGRPHVLALDGLRGLAIGLVILIHFTLYLGMTEKTLVDRLVNRVFLTGWCGVDLFFTLSGFLITGILLDSRNQPGYFRNCRRASDGGQAALVKVLKRFALFATQITRDTGGRKLPHLNCGRRKARNRLPVLLLDRCQISQHEYLGISGKRQIRSNLDATRAVDWRSKQFPERRG